MDIYKQLEQDEGRKRLPYKDLGGVETIGVGHNLGDPLSDAAIDAQLKADVADATARLSHLVAFRKLAAEPGGIIRQYALINMTFNLGYYGILGFHTMWDRIEHGDYAGAAKAGLESKWAQQVGKRAKRVMYQLEHGEWPPTSMEDRNETLDDRSFSRDSDNS